MGGSIWKFLGNTLGGIHEETNGLVDAVRDFIRVIQAYSMNIKLILCFPPAFRHIIEWGKKIISTIFNDWLPFDPISSADEISIAAFIITGYVVFYILGRSPSNGIILPLFICLLVFAYFGYDAHNKEGADPYLYFLYPLSFPLISGLMFLTSKCLKKTVECIINCNCDNAICNWAAVLSYCFQWCAFVVAIILIIPFVAFVIVVFVMADSKYHNNRNKFSPYASVFFSGGISMSLFAQFSDRFSLLLLFTLIAIILVVIHLFATYRINHPKDNQEEEEVKTKNDLFYSETARQNKKLIKIVYSVFIFLSDIFLMPMMEHLVTSYVSGMEFQWSLQLAIIIIVVATNLSFIIAHVVTEYRLDKNGPTNIENTPLETNGANPLTGPLPRLKYSSDYINGFRKRECAFWDIYQKINNIVYAILAPLDIPIGCIVIEVVYAAALLLIRPYGEDSDADKPKKRRMVSKYVLEIAEAVVLIIINIITLAVPEDFTFSFAASFILVIIAIIPVVSSFIFYAFFDYNPENYEKKFSLVEPSNISVEFLSWWVMVISIFGTYLYAASTPQLFGLD